MNTVVNIAAVVFVLAAQAGDGGCEPADASGISFDCHVQADPLKLDARGRVTTVVRNWCDKGKSPRSQDTFAWIQTRINSATKWEVAPGQSGVEHVPPDVEGLTFQLRTTGRCQADIEYGAAWRAKGTDRHGARFDTGIKELESGVTGLC